ncbi:ROK family protein [Planctomycetes bacterium K23_9]|uniref:Glucokinase n=1 Tax=Stieleria marina TaxID=1930275 RepID=A0A517P1Q8_9BACT|nr:Glucokinase [Planctomycetes bacterium K23_9]
MSHSKKLTSPADAKGPSFWGIDVGGTGIKIGLVDNVGQTLSYHRIPTRESEGPRAAMEHVAKVITDAEQELGIRADIPRIGLGAPGPMDLPRGYLVAPPQLPSWWDYPIRDTVAELLGRPVSFLNDANAAAYGEFWLGSAKGQPSMVLLTLGTGVGGGIIVDGELVNGVNSCGSECGHILVDPSPTAQLCVWGGGRGHLEAYASASGVVQRTHGRLTDGSQSVLRGHLGGTDRELTAKRVYEAAAAGDELALEIVDETGFWLGIGITTLVHTLDPGSVVLGGAMNFGGPGDPIGERFRSKISETFRERTFPNVFDGTTITFASLGADAGYLGVAGYARKEYLDEQLKTRIASEAS